MIQTSETTVSENLKRSEAEAIGLFLTAKRAFWVSRLPLFVELARDYEHEVDCFGRRICALGGEPVEPVELAAVTEQEAIGRALAGPELLRDLLTAELAQVQHLVDSRRTACAAHDGCTAALYDRMAQLHQRHRWQLRQALREPNQTESPLTPFD